MSLEYGVEYKYRKTPTTIYHATKTTKNERGLGYLLNTKQTNSGHSPATIGIKKMKNPTR